VIFVYQPQPSFLQRMDAVSKLVWLIIVGVFVLMAQDWFINASVFACVLATGFWLGRVRPGMLFRRLIPLWFAAIWLFFLFSVVFPGGVHTLWRLGPLRATTEGAFYGLTIALRVASLGSSSVIFASTTDPRRLVNELVEVVHLPYRFAFAFYAGLRFLPLLQTEVWTIANARAVRGQGRVASGVLDRLDLLRGVTVTVLARMIRRVQITAVAMDSRGFGAYRTRTPIDDVVRPRLGVAFVSLWGLALIAFIVLYVVLGGHGILRAPISGNH
jgi:energy-coupling factor transport system permease protein